LSPSASAAPSAPLILVVDDDDDSVHLVRDVLERHAYAVVVASNGKAALDGLVEEQGIEPSLILLDLRMPTLSGWEFLAIVKSYVRLSSIPVIVMTAGAVRPEAMRHGTVAAWLQKPFTPDDLLAAVRAHVRVP